MRLDEVVEYLSGSIISEMATKHFEKENVINAINSGNIDAAIDAYEENAKVAGEEVFGGSARPTITVRSLQKKVNAGTIKVGKKIIDLNTPEYVDFKDNFNKFAEELCKRQEKLIKSTRKTKAVARKEAKKAEEETEKKTKPILIKKEDLKE